MSSTPDDDEPTIVPIRSRDGPRSAPGVTGLGLGNTLPLGTGLDEFEITGLVGEGGFGIVYLAHDHILDRDVALKEYMPSTLAARGESATVVVRSARFEEPFQAGLRSFINEARLLARFDHPSLLKVYRFWGANGTAYMAMPFYEGITLKVLLKKIGRPPDEAWLKDLLRPLLDALQLLHDDQVFHRDIAPDNILMLDEDRPLLLDFGAARRVIGDLTHELTAILKPGYAPIEQYAESTSMKQGPWTDIYALASVMYFAIMGRAPDPSVARLMADPLVPLEAAAAGRYSAPFLRAIDRALSVKPQDRPQSIAELRTLLALGDRRRQPRAPLPAATTVAEPDDATTVRAPAAGQWAKPPPLSAPAPGVHAPGQTGQVPDPGPALSRDATPPPSQRPAHATRPATHPPRSAAPDASIAPPARSRAIRSFVLLTVALLAVIGAPAAYLLYTHWTTGAPPDSQRPQVPPPSPATRPAPLPEQPASAPSVARAPFSAELMLQQVLDGSDRTHTVTVTPEPLSARSGPGAVRFAITSAKPAYLYVLALGTRESDFALVFPNTIEADNRLEAGEVRSLPGSHWSWPMRGPADRSRFVAITSDVPRDFSRLATRPDGPFRRFPLDVGARAYRDYTGTTPLYAGEVRCDGTDAACSHAYGAVLFSLEPINPAATGTAPAKTARAKTAPTGEESAGTRRNPSTKIGSRPECADILQRASLGEPLSAREQATLREDCR